MNYFTLRALAAEWNDRLSGAVVADSWSQSAGELSLGLEKGSEASTVRILCDPKMALMFRAEGHGRARRNTATLFEEARGLAVTGIQTAERDRFMFIGLENTSAFQIQLFGSRPNVFWVQDGVIGEAFLTDEEWAREAAPTPRPAPEVASIEAFRERWRPDRKTLAQAVSATIPLLDRQLAEEVVCRAKLDGEGLPSDATEGDVGRLFDSAEQMQKDLQTPRPTVYWRGAFVEAFSLVPLKSVPDDWRAEAFATVDAALGVYSKRKLAQQGFMEAFKPVESALAASLRKQARSAEALRSDLDHPSRADAYEAWGHLLMAKAADREAGQESITLPDILKDPGSGPGQALPEITIKLDPALTAIENAQRFYSKARQTRAARKHAEVRRETVQSQADEAGRLLQGLRALERHADLEAFLTTNRAALAPFLRPEALGKERLPYRRFEIGGWEIRVGRNAKSNAELTTKFSGPHDLWLHARGVPGSHVVIRRPNKTADVPKRVIEVAAQLAAHFSEAKSQPLAPVIVTERKFVRPIKGGAPGLVHVDREDVVMVEPGVPREDAGKNG